ncbi:MAG: serine/threonine protein kinase, partial [Deltaproteobacteria bacterium]
MSDDPRTLKDGRYLLVKPLGEGGMATVYRAYDQRLGVWRAIKLLLPHVAKREKLRKRFETEARTMAVLEHRHIVRIYDVDRDGPHLFMVMEMLTGGALVDWLEDHGMMPPQMAVRAMLETCEGVAFAHKRGVVHRDLKPHNVLLDNEGVCKVTDFGIARAADPERSLTATGAIMGTHGYMAPEQKVDAKNVDGRADIYALGATLYALVTNRPPPDLFVSFQNPEMLAPVPAALRDVIMMATEYMAEDRYATVEEFAGALREAARQLPPDPRGVPPLVRPQGPEPSAPDPAAYNVTASHGAIGATMIPAEQATAVPTTRAGTHAAESTLAGDLDDAVFTLGDREPQRKSGGKAGVWMIATGLVGLLVGAVGLAAGGLFLASQRSEPAAPPAPHVAPLALAPEPTPEPDMVQPETVAPTPVEPAAVAPTPTPVA